MALGKCLQKIPPDYPSLPVRTPSKSRATPLGPVSQKSRKRFGPEKPLVKLRLAYSVTLVFLYVVTGIKIKLTAKFRASRRLSFEDTKRIMSPEMRPKSFGTFEKQAPGPSFRRRVTRRARHGGQEAVRYLYIRQLEK